MIHVVRFDTAKGKFAVRVEDVREVRNAVGITQFPDPIEGVAGLLRMEHEAITVLAVLGPGEQHVMILQPAGRPFGLLVSMVAGVTRIDPGQIGPPPAGQSEGIVSGVIELEGELVLMLDAAALERRLDR